MKNLYLLALTLLAFNTSIAQNITIPDSSFKNLLVNSNSTTNLVAKNISGNYIKIDANSDGEIQLSEVLQVGFLFANNATITSLEGINSFSNLTALNCNNNHLSSLTINNLTNLLLLDCSNNQLTSLSLNGLNNLNYLKCSNNLIPSLAVNSLTNLQQFECSSNHISSLNLNGLLNLTYLDCSSNQLPSLNVSSLTALQALYCNSNTIPSLAISNLSSLLYIDCSSNQIPSINFNGLVNLESIACDSNQLPSLDVNGLINLQYLSCAANQIPSLNLSGLVNLQTLECSSNQITTLDCSELSNLQNLYCDANPIISLFIKNGSIETNVSLDNNPSLQFICADQAQVSSIQSLIAQYGYTNCIVNATCSFSTSQHDTTQTAFILYPNPAKQSIYIESPTGMNAQSIAVYNMVGQLVLKTSTPHTILDVSSLSSGTYIIKLLFDSEVLYDKFIKE